MMSGHVSPRRAFSLPGLGPAMRPAMGPAMGWAVGLAMILATAGCAVPEVTVPARLPAPRLSPVHPTGDFADIGFATWAEDEPAYRLYPGDVLDVSAPSAPELTRTVTVQPDGRIRLPLVPPVMAADRTLFELEAALRDAYRPELRDPRVEVSVKQASPLKIFVGGEVKTPGIYDMPGDIDALQGVLLAGGFLPTARRQEVVVIRRGVGGRPMMRTVDLRQAIYRPGRGDTTPLRRFDIVFVPKSTVGEIDQFIDLYIRQALPFQFSYAVGRNYVSAP